MASSIGKLVSVLPEMRFNTLVHFFSRYIELNRKLYQKSFDSHSYFDNHGKFSKARLYDLRNWTNSPHGGQVSITSNILFHAEKVFDTFKGENLGVYHKLYLLTDNHMLTCVFDSFRKLTFSTHGSDCVRFYTFSQFSGHAFLKVSNASVELLTDREHPEIAKTLIKSGVASVSSEHLAQKKNGSLIIFNEVKTKTFGLLADANSLLGRVMEEFPPPLRDFELANEIRTDLLFHAPNHCPVSLTLEVDMNYLASFHISYTKDFALASTKEKIVFETLSDYQLSLLEKRWQKRLSVKKLVKALNQKINYTVHHITLNF